MLKVRGEQFSQSVIERVRVPGPPIRVWPGVGAASSRIGSDVTGADGKASAESAARAD
jgi:hypothetical protein